MTYGDAMAARILELERKNKSLRDRLGAARRGRDMWKTRALNRTRFQR